MSNGEQRDVVNEEPVRDPKSHYERKRTMRFTAISPLVALTAVVTALAASAATGATGTVVTWRKTPIGNAITTSSGHTLYLFRADHGTTSTCYGQCATYWPPLLTTGKPVASGRVQVSLLGTTKRKDGKLQVTYKGHPLYTYLPDTKPGQTTGEGSTAFGAAWYALAPSGATIDQD
jgi:predicted lipoprotein with Yx(FWY)xxD motif